MTLEGYSLDPSTNVWVGKAWPDFGYSDGNEVENYLLETVRSATDLSSNSAELKRAIKDWPSEYHFSHKRAHLLGGLNIPNGAKVLELGCGCGAVTRMLGEAGYEVTAVEGSYLRASVAAQRCRDLKNVRVVCDTIQNFSIDQQWDVITLIGVLEYAPAFSNDADPFHQVLSNVYGKLKQGGVLIVAIENQLGLKYFAGHDEDHINQPFWGVMDLYTSKQPRVFGKKELIDRLRSSGFGNPRLLFPFPDYKLPDFVIDEAFLDEKELRAADLLIEVASRSYGHSVLTAFDEGLAWQAVARNGLLADLANSFIVLAPKGELPTWSKPSWLMRRYSHGRTTVIEKDGKQIVARKEVAGEPLPRMEVRLDDKRSVGSLERVQSVSPYIIGTSMFTSFKRLLRRGEGIQEISQWATPWVRLLNESTDGNGDLPADFVDCVSFNILIDEKGLPNYIDREWVLTGIAIPFRWILIRGLFLSMWRCPVKGVLVGKTFRTCIDEICRALGYPLTASDWEQSIALEAHLVAAEQRSSDIREVAQQFSAQLEQVVTDTSVSLHAEVSGLRRIEYQAGQEIDHRDRVITQLKKEMAILELQCSGKQK